MHISPRHAIYSAILSTKATATFTFLPTWKGSMITNRYSNLLTAFPHLCFNLGSIPASWITYATPQSWTCQEIPLPPSWNFHIIAVWNTAVRLCLSSHNPAWLQNLARDIPEAHTDTFTALLLIPYTLLDTLQQQLGSRSLRSLTQTKFKLPSAPTDLRGMQFPPFSTNPNRVSHSRLLTGSPGPVQMVATIPKKAASYWGRFLPPQYGKL